MILPEIKRLIENRFGRPILYSKDCEALAVSIKKYCNQTISATTLKRLFGFATELHAPRLFTLDVIANYCGYSDWKNMLLGQHLPLNGGTDKLKDEDVYYLQQQSSIFMSMQKIDFERVVELCEKFGDKSEIYQFVTDIIKLAAYIKDIGFLKELFNLPCIYNFKKHNDGKIYYLGHTVGIVLRGAPDMAAELVPVYAENPVAQRVMVEWFADEDYLDGYYGSFLDHYHRFRNESLEDRLFYYSMKYTQCCYAGDLENGRNWFRKIEETGIDQYINPKLAGRYLGICLMEEPHHLFSPVSSFYQHAVIYLDDSYENAMAFLLYAFRYLYRSGNKSWINGLTQMFEKQFRHREKLVMTYLGVKIENALSIYLAYSYFLEGKTETAMSCLEKVDTNLFNVYIYKQLEKDYRSVWQLLHKAPSPQILPAETQEFRSTFFQPI